MTRWIDHIVVRVNDINAALKDEGRFIELAEPLGDGALGRALEKYGEGVHLVALAVDDLAAATEEMKANGARVIQDGSQVFIHPKDGHGVMYQLGEKS